MQYIHSQQEEYPTDILWEENPTNNWRVANHRPKKKILGRSRWIHQVISAEGWLCTKNDFHMSYPLVMTNIAIENTPFIVDLPIENGDFP